MFHRIIGKAILAKHHGAHFRQPRWAQIAVLLLLCGFFGLIAGGPAVAAPVRIMPLGDSLTAGYTDPTAWTVPFTFGYRGPLYTQLTNAGFDFEFVGTSNEPWSLPYGPEFGLPSTIQGPDLRTLGEDNHRGYGGVTTGQLLNGPSASGSSNSFINLSSILNEDAPDIILLMIGINGVADAVNNIDPLVHEIYLSKPNVNLVIAQITPRSYYQQDIVDYNSLIANTVVPKYRDLGMRITLVDQYSNLLTNPADKTSINTSLFTDSAHLRPEGYALLADTWASAILPPQVSGKGVIAIPGGNEATFVAPISLIKDLPVSFTGGGEPLYQPSWAGWAQMNDGIVGPAAGNPEQTMLLDNLTGSETPWAVWELDTSVNTLGYDITSLESFSGFSGQRIWQKFEIKYALVGEPITPGEELAHILGTFEFQPDEFTGYNAAKLAIERGEFDDVIISGVSAIQIKYLDNGFNGNPDPMAGGNFTSYREFSVVGTATTVPEPSVTLLCGVALLGFLLGRPRCRQTKHNET